jgi:hypothetical protein
MFRGKMFQKLLAFIGKDIMTMTNQVVTLHPEEGKG